MKLTATFLMGLGLCWGLALGCGGGVEGPRTNGEDSAGTSPLMTAGGGGPGTGGSTTTTAGSSAGGSSSAAGTSAGGTGGSGMGQPCGPEWMKGMTYAEGSIVLFQGAYYVALHENPGYDPTISTYFWDPYSCASSGTGGSGSGVGGSAPLGDSAFDNLVAEELFNPMFPDRNGFYTYQGLGDANR